MRIVLLIFFFFALNLFIPSKLEAAVVDSLIQELESNIINENPKMLLENHNRCWEIVNACESTERFEDLIRYCKIGLTISEKLDSFNYKTGYLFYLGYGYERTNDYTKALENYFMITNNGQVDPMSNMRISSLSQIANIYMAMGNYEKAYEYQMQAIGAYEMTGDTANIARSSYMLGSIFFYQKRFKDALKIYQEVQQISEQKKTDRLTYAALGAIGSTYEELGDYEKSMLYNQKALILAESINLKSGIAYSLGNIGIYHFRMGNCSAAEKELIRSIKLKNKLNDAWGVAGSKLSLADVYIKCNQNAKIVSLMDEVLAVARQMGSKNRELEVYERLIKHYEKESDLTNALVYSKKYIALKDTILNEKTVEEMGQSKQRYELQKKEHEISLLKADNEILMVSKQNQRLIRYIYFAIIFLFIISSIWFFSRLKMQRKINAMLADKNNLLNSKNEEIDIKNQELDVKNKELDVKNRQLEHSNEDLQQFAYVASHDLKEPLRMIHSYTSLLERRYNDMLDDNGKEFMHYIVDAVDRMKTLLDDLLDYSRSGTQGLPDKLVDVGDTMILVESNLRHRLMTCNGTLEVRRENLPAIKAHSSQLMQLLQNLVSNGLKFKGDRDPLVIVDCYQKDNLHVFSVKDNGIGISKENQEKVFEMFRRLHTREEYEGTGIGLATCKRIVSNMGGDIWVESVEGEGSTFFFSVPCVEEVVAAV